MGVYDFSVKLGSGDAGAQVIDVNASYKDMSQVCRAIKHKPVAKAREVLEQAISKKKAIQYSKFAKHLGHRKELGGKRGRYPIKEAKVALRLLNDAVANARQKALDTESLVVSHAAAYKQRVYPRYRKYWASGTILGYGKQSIMSRYVTCRAELVVSETGRKGKPAAGKPAEKKAEAKKPEAKKLEARKPEAQAAGEKAVEKPGEKPGEKPEEKELKKELETPKFME
jgi:ribosomal protein uL22